MEFLKNTEWYLLIQTHQELFVVYDMMKLLSHNMKRMNPSPPRHLSCLSLLVPVLGVVPVQPLLVELDHNLRDLGVGLLGRYEVRLITSLPLDQEEKLPRVICRSNDSLCSQSSRESSGLIFIFVLLFLLLSSLGLVFLLIILDFVLAVEILYRLPSVLRLILIALPLDKILRLPLLDSFFQEFFHFVNLGIRSLVGHFEALS